MSNSRISSQRRRVIDVGDVLAQVISREGPALLSEILKDRAQKTPQAEDVSPPPRASRPARKTLRDVSEWLKQVRSHGVGPVSRHGLEEVLAATKRNLATGRELARVWRSRVRDTQGRFQSLGTPFERTEFVVLLALQSASYLGGLAVGAQVPKIDVRLFPVGRRSDAITVHSAPQLSLEVSLEWVRAILKRTLHAADIGDADRRRIDGMIQLCAQLSEGIEKGLAAREKVARVLPFLRRRSTRVRSIPMDAQSYQVADAILSALSGIKS
jgi:hypothetical protein